MTLPNLGRLLEELRTLAPVAEPAPAPSANAPDAGQAPAEPPAAPGGPVAAPEPALEAPPDAPATLPPRRSADIPTIQARIRAMQHAGSAPAAPAAPADADEAEEREAALVARRADETRAHAADASARAALAGGEAPSVIIRIPAPRPHQREVLDDGHRFKLWRAGRRVGKTRTEFIGAVRGHGPRDPSTGARKFKGIAQAGDIAWIAPDYPQSDTIWEEEILPRFYGRAGVTISEKHRLVGLGKQLGEDADGEPVYRGTIRIRSAENINSVRGKEFDGLIAEEAAFWPFLSAWRRVLRPTLINRRGWAIVASSTDLGSDFNQLAAEVEEHKRGPNWAAFHHRTRDIPFIDDEEKADLAHDYPPGSSEEQQELDAELLETLGTLFQEKFFRYYDAISTHAVWIDGLRYEFEYLVLTADLAASLKEQADYTAFTVAGVTFAVDGVRRVAIIEIVNEHLEGPDQIDELEDLMLRYRPRFTDLESIGYQLTAVQHLKRRMQGRGYAIEGVTLKGDKRAKAVPAAAAISRGEWFLPKSAPWLDDARKQLLKFPNGREKSKLVADHDDIVDTFSILAARVGGRVNSTWRVRKIRK